MSLPEALAKASRTEGIPSEVLAEIEATLGPIALSENEQPVPEIVEETPEIDIKSVGPLQVLTYMQAAGEGDQGWVIDEKIKSRTFRAGIRDGLGIGGKQLTDILLGFEADDCLELVKRPVSNQIPVVENGRILKKGEKLLDHARSSSPELVAEAEKITMMRFIEQIEDMRNEIHHAFDFLLSQCGERISVDYLSQNGLAGSQKIDPVASDLDQAGLAELVRIPTSLGQIQKELERKINQYNPKAPSVVW
jgi:hypothetical protein